jgi:hypothetical protein
MSFTLQPIRVATGVDEEGMLVLDERERLVAVLTRLGEPHDGLAGRWFLEAGFGHLDEPDHTTFADLDAAQDWIGKRLAPEWRRGVRPGRTGAPGRDR